jgi:hypothetical protein
MVRRDENEIQIPFLVLAFRDIPSLRTHFPGGAYCMILLYVFIAHVKNTFYADAFLAYKLYRFQPA